MASINTAKFRKEHPASWNEVWRIIKAEAPDYAEGLQDPFFKECIEMFDAEIELELADLPERARALIPASVITN